MRIQVATDSDVEEKGNDKNATLTSLIYVFFQQELRTLIPDILLNKHRSLYGRTEELIVRN